jgi:hypothetical protein
MLETPPTSRMWLEVRADTATITWSNPKRTLASYLFFGFLPVGVFGYFAISFIQSWSSRRTPPDTSEIVFLVFWMSAILLFIYGHIRGMFRKSRDGTLCLTDNTLRIDPEFSPTSIEYRGGWLMSLRSAKIRTLRRSEVGIVYVDPPSRALPAYGVSVDIGSGVAEIVQDVTEVEAEWMAKVLRTWKTAGKAAFSDEWAKAA